MSKRFECLKCGGCCRYVKFQILYSDFERWLRQERWDILSKVICRDTEELGGWVYMDFSFPERETADCPFFKDNLCTIYDTRPFICRAYPLLFESTCPGLGKGKVVSKSVIKGLFRELHENAALVYEHMEEMRKVIRYARTGSKS